MKGGHGDAGDNWDVDNIENDEEDSGDEQKEDNDSSKKILHRCEVTPGCIKTFRRIRDYQMHMDDKELCLVPEEKLSSSNHLVARYIAKNGISHQYQSKTYQETRSTVFSKEILPAIDPLFLG